MARVPTPPTPPATPLFWAAYYFDLHGDTMYNLGSAISSLPFIGSPLSGPFKGLGNIMRQAAIYCNSADSYIQNTWRWVSYIVEANGFIDLLGWASSHFLSIRSSANSWLQGRLAAINSYLPYLWLNQLYWINHFISGTFTWWLDFLNNPTGKVLEWLNNNYWWLPQFFSSPGGYILALIRAAQPIINSLLNNPQQWFIGYLRSSYWWLPQFLDNPIGYVFAGIKALDATLNGFLTDPTGFMRSRIQTLFKVGSDFWDNPLLYITNYVLNQFSATLDQFGERLKDLAVAVILKYI